MKNYLFKYIAVLFAVAAVAFTKIPKVPTATFPFHYIASTYAQSDVQNNSNWASGLIVCSTPPFNKACLIQVTDTYTHLVGTTRVLNTTGNVLIIKAIHGVNGIDFVPDVASSIGIASKSDKS
jgi:hypothetical protein